VVYEVLSQSPERLVLRTHDRARRGRGVLFATAPFVVYLAFCTIVFAVAAGDLTLWEKAKTAAAAGAGVATALAVAAFVLGRRIHDVIEADQAAVRIDHSPALGASRRLELRYADLEGFAVDPSLRSLGADVLLVAVTREGTRRPIAEGEPHSSQVRDVARKLAFLSKLPLAEPRYASGGQKG
jgi:hypothetical protein